MSQIALKTELQIGRPNFLGGGTWDLKNLTPITVIFGKNGSGKSQLLRGILNLDRTHHHYSVPERTGEIQYNVNLTSVESDGEKRASRISRNWLNEYRDSVISRVQVFLSKRGGFRETPQNATALIHIEKTLHDLLPDFEFEIAKSITPPIIMKRNGEQITETSKLSSGETEAYTLALDLLLICSMWEIDNENGILLIDEPDPHLHPDLQQRFAKFLVELNLKFNCQIFVSTHSTTLLSALGHYGNTKTSVIYLNRNQNEQKAIQFNENMQKFATCLGGHALMGPLFHFPILLVEGDDDYRIWSEVPRHGQIGISVIPCNGTEIFEYQKMLEKLFASMIDDQQSNSGFALLDGDKEIPNVSQNHVKFLRLNCHESENLYLTDEILKVLKYDWQNACQKVITESSKYGNKAQQLASIQQWDRQKIDCKTVINELQNILDDKNVNWAHRLGKEIGKNKPAGQLARFLGTQVVNTLWK